MEYETDFWDTKYTKLSGEYHSFDDEPAVITMQGSMFWYTRGKLHRDNDLPAVIHKSGEQVWCQNNKAHRDNDLPAVVYASGHAEWWLNGEMIRECEDYFPLKSKSARN